MVTSAVPERHPDQDQLADLAAEVLPIDLARSVEAHVMGCTLCERLLADAERVRRLLFADDPGPMPEEVWSRLEGALKVEAVTRHRTSDGAAAVTAFGPPSGRPGWFEAPPTGSYSVGAPVARTVDGSPASDLTRPLQVPPHPVVAPSPQMPEAVVLPPPEPSPLPAAPPAVTAPPAATAPPAGLPPSPPPSMSFDEAPTAAWKAFLDDPGPAAVPEAVPLRVGRVVRSSIRSRRDVRSEDKAAGRRPRPVVLAAAAAAVAAVLGLGGGAFMLLSGDGAGSAPAPSADLAHSRSVLTRSGREYTAATLIAQAKALLSTRASVPVTSSASIRTATSSTGTPRPASPSAAGSPSSGSTGAAATRGTVADPQQLQSCLTGLGESGRHVLAVDLARYQGRDAAVIVVQGSAGGWDVWAVAPQCKAGAEMPLAFKSVPA